MSLVVGARKGVHEEKEERAREEQERKGDKVRGEKEKERRNYLISFRQRALSKSCGRI